MGGSVARMARIWPGDVCVRSSQRAVVRRRSVASGAPGRHVDGVPQVTRRVVGRDVEGLEVERVGLDLGALEDDEAELAEDARDLAFGLADGMQRRRAGAADRAA